MRKGFTLLEAVVSLLAVAVIVSILVGIYSTVEGIRQTTEKVLSLDGYFYEELKSLDSVCPEKLTNRPVYLESKSVKVVGENCFEIKKCFKRKNLFEGEVSLICGRWKKDERTFGLLQ